ncbi:MAG: hypothetical protein HYY45_07480 [Deltaproteobacteria bacterium]|nr:hypothetical protein [Deltaproteobacteria bacterium]
MTERTKIAYVRCPKCGEEFHIMAEDFAQHRDMNCHCPFCHKEFLPSQHLVIGWL